MNDRLKYHEGFDELPIFGMEGLAAHRTLPWLFNIPSTFDPDTVIARLCSAPNTQFGVEIGCGDEPVRSYLIAAGLWFAFDLRRRVEDYWTNAQYDFSSAEHRDIPNSYRLLLAPLLFSGNLIPNNRIHTYVLRNPNWAGSSLGDSPNAFSFVPRYEELLPGQRLVIIRNHFINGPYEKLLEDRGYPTPSFKDWTNQQKLLSNRPLNLEVNATLFDFTKT